ncbi:PAS domain-containing protein [Rhizobium sp. PP-F2F-G48]|uniref:PAS domain-containing protein n=1 Tax=Rhizobium sp. PP-F2F-G48 TaxID=2135651 RepID=UPI00105212BE|nr:PAS domain-containing protein [Rhizobium sp. PP-F2F-G48]TCM55739.1 PAS domain-containing protein [Rhizobium sp. PP-F2F-G48]
MPKRRLSGHDATGQAPHEEMAGNPRMMGISSRHFLKLVEDRGVIGFWSMDFETGHINGSVGMYRLLGLPPSTRLTFTELLTMMHPGDRTLNGDMLAVIRSGQPLDRDFRLIRHDRTLRWIESKAEVLVDSEGIPRRALGLFIDVTERHEARVIVEEGWRSYRSLVSAIAAVEWRMSPEGRITSLKTWDALTGQTLAEADNWGWAEMVHPDERDAALSLWAECAAARRPYALDLRIRCVDGPYRTYLVRGAPLYNADETLREWICVLVEPAAIGGANEAPPLEDFEGLGVAHIRAARAILNWSIENLSTESGVSVSTIRRIEQSAGMKTRLPHMRALLKALENGGVRFGHGPNRELTISC